LVRQANRAYIGVLMSNFSGVEDPMGKEEAGQVRDSAMVRSMLRDAGYSEKAVNYYLETPHLGVIENADQVSEMTGTCGDTIKVYLKIENERISDVKYQIMGCPGSISAAMAAGDLVRNRTVDEALALNDGDVFQFLEEIPVKKHHCIQLAVKALLGAIKTYRDGDATDDQVLKAGIPTGHGRRGKDGDDGTTCCGTPKGQGDCTTAGACCGKAVSLVEKE
jgi:nitrogen fixation NifU-like protein